jgi:hypothetical protein
MLRHLAGLGLLSLLHLPGVAAAGDSSQGSAGLRAAVIAKVLSYDRTVGEKARRVVVAHGDSSGHRIAVGVVAALQGQGVEAKAVPVAELQAEPPPAAVYLASPQGVEKVQRYCVTMKVLSLAHDLELVKEGHLSIALVQGSERSLEIWVNLSRAKAEWQDLAAELLQVARVVH